MKSLMYGMDHQTQRDVFEDCIHRRIIDTAYGSLIGLLWFAFGTDRPSDHVRRQIYDMLHITDPERTEE